MWNVGDARSSRSGHPGPVDEHYLDAELRLLGEDAPPDDRLDVIWTAYERGTGKSIGRPPTGAERACVKAWLQAMRGTDSFPVFSVPRRTLRQVAALSLSEKANSLVQAPCTTCEPLLTADGRFALNLATAPINVDPWSRQSNPNASRLKTEVHDELAARGHFEPWTESPLCVTIVSLVSKETRTKDVDNVVKGLLDAMQGVLYVNDRGIQCLTTRRVEYAGPAGLYLVAARAVHEWSDDVVHDDPSAPVVLSGRRIELP